MLHTDARAELGVVILVAYKMYRHVVGQIKMRNRSARERECSIVNIASGILKTFLKWL